MMNSMDSGVMGMMAHQQRMDVIGNDIANINTVGYKQSNVAFQEAFVQSLRMPMSGIQGMQAGMGVQVGQISRSFTPGSFSQDGEPTHLAISGNGFFVVGNGYLTRAGDFIVESTDAGAFLSSSNGMRLQGVIGTGAMPDTLDGLTDMNLREGLEPNQVMTSVSVGMDGVIRRSVDGGELENVGRIALAAVDNPAGLEAMGGNVYRQTPAARAQGVSSPGEAGIGQINQGYLENSNVDMAYEFTEMIKTQRGFQANSRVITTSDDMLQEALTLKR